MAVSFWHSDVPAEDDFGDKINLQFVDGRTIYGPWAIMTPKSFKLRGMGLGTGKGQLYEQQTVQGDKFDGFAKSVRWVKISG